MDLILINQQQADSSILATNSWSEHINEEPISSCIQSIREGAGSCGRKLLPKEMLSDQMAQIGNSALDLSTLLYTTHIPGRFS